MARTAAPRTADPKGTHDGEPLTDAKLYGTPTPRPYAQAITPEHREALGVEAPKGEESAQAAVERAALQG